MPPAQQRFESVSRLRCCAVLASDGFEAHPARSGTGTAVRARDDLFVVTCAHVLGDFLRYGAGWVNFFIPGGSKDRPSVQVDRRDCSVEFLDYDLDQAVLKVRRAVADNLTFLTPLAVEEMGTDVDYARALPGSGPLFCLAGFPGEIIRSDRVAKRMEMNSLVLGATVLANGPADLVLDYSHGVWNDGKPFDPRGISGALLYEVPPDAYTEGGPRTPAVAVAYGWDPNNHVILCSPAHNIRKLLMR